MPCVKQLKDGQKLILLGILISLVRPYAAITVLEMCHCFFLCCYMTGSLFFHQVGKDESSLGPTSLRIISSFLEHLDFSVDLKFFDGLETMIL